MTFDLQKATEYLRSFEADGQCKILGIDSYGNKITISGEVSPDFLLIAGAYMEGNWGVTLATSGVVAK